MQSLLNNSMKVHPLLKLKVHCIITSLHPLCGDHPHILCLLPRMGCRHERMLLIYLTAVRLIAFICIPWRGHCEWWWWFMLYILMRAYEFNYYKGSRQMGTFLFLIYRKRFYLMLCEPQ